jgi:citrate lyase subunit beta/citryl-CoA lyase
MGPSVRSLLFAPADQPRKLAKAWLGPAAAVIADLEDAVVEERKHEARTHLAALAGTPSSGRVVVRINALGTPHAADDLALVQRMEHVDAVLVPKADEAALAQLPDGLPPVVALVETAAGVLQAPAIAAHPAVARLMLGTVDLAAELGVAITADGAAFAYARSALVLASAAAGLPAPIDGVWTGIADEAGLRTEAAHARALGFGAKACVHPAQVAVVEEIFAPTAAEVSWAQAVVAGAERGLAAGQGAVAVDGRMVDRPVLARARQLLATAERNPA